jgi:hypothetical protein
VPDQVHPLDSELVEEAQHEAHVVVGVPRLGRRVALPEARQVEREHARLAVERGHDRLDRLEMRAPAVQHEHGQIAVGAGRAAVGVAHGDAVYVHLENGIPRGGAVTIR